MSEKKHTTKWKRRRCSICDESERLKLLHHRTLQLKVNDGWFIFEQYDTVCNGCGFVFNGRVPDESFIREYYEKSVIRVKADYDSESRLKLIKELIPSGSKVIEFGSGRGEFVDDLNNAGYIADGLDYIDDAGSDLIYDAAIAYYVLEHVINPGVFIKKMKSFVVDGGFIIVEVPDFHNYTEHSLYHEHLNHFTVQHLTTLFTMNDLQVLKVLTGHSRDFGFAIVGINNYSNILDKKYRKTMFRIKEYWTAKNG